MIVLEDRRSLVADIEQARKAGARLQQACATAGIDVRTLQRWKAADGLVVGDRRPGAVRPRPAHALTEAERSEILTVVNQARFADMPPVRIVPMLADEGRYLASESSFSRLLREHGQQRHAGQDVAIPQARHALYQQARQAHPARWSGPTRNWTRIEAVALNPEKDSVVTAATKTQIAA